mmetsp:Transcript_95338/g.294029  ORF Transcript_95338/g.294029 Transcript_95338/m.294029 type:complete len:92 (+) Transcript_95338:375-650(+)
MCTSRPHPWLGAPPCEALEPPGPPRRTEQAPPLDVRLSARGRCAQAGARDVRVAAAAAAGSVLDVGCRRAWALFVTVIYRLEALWEQRALH